MQEVPPQNPSGKTQLRKSFIQTLTDLAYRDPRVVLIVGDVGFSFIEAYKQKFPNQFLNCGIQEQAMMGYAAGLANVGWKPAVYTMKNFILLRPHEQLRNDICFPNLNVKLFGVGGSAAYKFLGMSHNLFDGEEEAILKTLPNLNTYFPKTEQETEEAMLKEYERSGPAYFSI